MELSQILILSGIAFLTSVFSAVAGFGGGFVIILVFGLFFDLKAAIALSTLCFICGTGNKTLLYRKPLIGVWFSISC